MSRLVLAALGVLITSCSGASTAAGPNAHLPPIRHVAAPRNEIAAVARLQLAYQSGNWSAVRNEVSDAGTARSLVSMLRAWKGEGVSSLRVSLVHNTSLGHGQYVATLSFSADPRTIPEYGIYLFQARSAHLVRAITGIQGSSYRTAHWDVTRLAHFVVYHSPYQLAGTDHRFLTELEQERTDFAREFHVHLPPLAAVYVYPTVGDMSRLTHKVCGGTPGEIGCTDPFAAPPTIHTVIRAIFHEAIHVYEVTLTPPGFVKNGVQEEWVAPLFVGEGTAVALQDPSARTGLSDYCSDLEWAPLNSCAADAIASVNPATILSDKGFKRANPGDAYALGGSFVTYLIQRHGYQRFGKFYYALAHQPSDSVRDYNVATRQVYGATIQSLLSSWKSWLCQGHC